MNYAIEIFIELFQVLVTVLRTNWTHHSTAIFQLIKQLLNMLMIEGDVTLDRVIQNKLTACGIVGAVAPT